MLPIIDLNVFNSQPFLSSPLVFKSLISSVRKAAEALITYGALLLQDNRLFLSTYPELKQDERPELGYQVGVTLENTEKPKCAVDEPCLKVIARLEPDQRPLDITAHQPDPKCRFFWRMGDMPPYETQFPALNASNVVPRAENLKDRWAPIMEKWGIAMKSAVEGLAQMTAVGLGLPPETFTDAGKYGPHLLAPTASDLVKYHKKDTILAGFHTDLNFLTIHGRSRYPGLHIWARNTGKRIPVQFPQPQLEHLTGGLIKAGYHEVVVNEATIATVQRRKTEYPDRPLIRISSTFFWHLSSDYDLVPIPSLVVRSRTKVQEDVEDTIYEPMKVGQQVQSELRHIALMV
ncbi:hypothetical protein BGW80DRAFT_1434073 [Lactifluus volemus]|nr:hypothetical protein BGW80DRAFT_1434073 [Lactifluus volemus]